MADRLNEIEMETEHRTDPAEIAAEDVCLGETETADPDAGDCPCGRSLNHDWMDQRYKICYFCRTK